MTRTRGSDVQIRLIVNGELETVWNANSFEVNEDENKERIERLGTSKKPNEKTVDGFSGTLEFDADGPELDDLLDAAHQARRDRQDYKFNILDRTYYPKSGESRTYVYPNCVFSLSKSASGQKEAVTQSLEWQSEMRRKV